jgi:hypothetical protein
MKKTTPMEGGKVAVKNFLAFYVAGKASYTSYSQFMHININFS